MTTLITHRLFVPAVLLGLLSACDSQPKAQEASTAVAHVDPFQDTPEVTIVSMEEQEEVVEAVPAKPLPRPEILRVEDLPVRYYPVEVSATEFMASDERFGEVAEALRVDIASDLESYDIKDRAGLRQLHSTLMNIAIMQGRYADARGHIESIRSLHTDPAQIETTGLMMGALIDAWEQAGPDNPAAAELYARSLAERVNAMPWDVISEDIIARQENAGRMDPAIFTTIISTGLDPMFEQDGQIDSTVARQLVTLKSILDIQMPVMEQTSTVYLEIIKANNAK
ncbi:MAG: hypothetical protein MK095_09110 [Phycisphaerales bacterium]|nr:hypothetical protein [Phycisphaerales bacterium]